MISTHIWQFPSLLNFTGEETSPGKEVYISQNYPIGWKLEIHQAWNIQPCLLHSLVYSYLWASNLGSLRFFLHLKTEIIIFTSQSHCVDQICKVFEAPISGKEFALNKMAAIIIIQANFPFLHSTYAVFEDHSSYWFPNRKFLSSWFISWKRWKDVRWWTLSNLGLYCPVV